MKNNIMKLMTIITATFLITSCGDKANGQDSNIPMGEDITTPKYDSAVVLEFLQTDLFKQNNHYFLKVCLGSIENGYFEYFSSKSGRLLAPVLKINYEKQKPIFVGCDLTKPYLYKNLNDLIKFIPAS
jgi:hypothetical protein